MTGIKNNYIVTDQESIKVIQDRELFISFALDKIGVPHDHIGASALLSIAVDTWLVCGTPPEGVIKMLRQQADMLELDLVHKVEKTQCPN